MTTTTATCHCGKTATGEPDELAMAGWDPDGLESCPACMQRCREHSWARTSSPDELICVYCDVIRRYRPMGVAA